MDLEQMHEVIRGQEGIINQIAAMKVQVNNLHTLHQQQQQIQQGQTVQQQQQQLQQAQANQQQQQNNNRRRWGREQQRPKGYTSNCKTRPMTLHKQ